MVYSGSTTPTMQARVTAMLDERPARARREAATPLREKGDSEGPLI
jgi:hypothetical protein